MDRSAILPAVRIRPRARSASTAPRRSPSISASIIAVAEAPVISEATEPSLMPADSSALPSRWISEVRACTVFIRYLVRSRTSLRSAGGIIGPAQQPALEQLRQPPAVRRVGLMALQRLDVRRVDHRDL